MRRLKSWTEALHRWWARREHRLLSESGSASLEFVTAGMILLLPLVYLVLTVSAVQGAAFAAEGAARQAARVFVQAADDRIGSASAQRAIEFALADYGIDTTSADVQVACSPRPGACLTRLGSISVTVTVSVPLPLVPPVLDVAVPLRVPMTATATQQVSRFWGTG